MDSLYKEIFQFLFEYVCVYGFGSIIDVEVLRMVDFYWGLQEKQLVVLYWYVQEVVEKMLFWWVMCFLQIEVQLDVLEVLQIGKQVLLIN